MSASRRAAVCHSETLSPRVQCGRTTEEGRCSPGTNMGPACSLMPGDGTAIQKEDSELNQDGLTSSYTYEAPPQVECLMKRELKYFFMNPYEKFTARGRKPWKLAIQIIKIVLVTTQLCFFGFGQFSVVSYAEENIKAFEHIFLLDWQSTYDSGVYPSTKSLYAVYEVKSFYEHTDKIVVQYSNINTTALGTYVMPLERRIKVLVEEYEQFDIMDDFYKLNLKVNTSTTYIPIVANMTGFKFKKCMAEQNNSINFDRLKTLRLQFSIHSVHVKDEDTSSPPDCIIFDVTILFDNTPHSGRISVQLTAVIEMDTKCSSKTRKQNQDVDDWGETAGIICMDIFVIVLGITSTILCSRSIINGYSLCQKTCIYFERYRKRKLTRSEKMEFINLWYVMIILSDCLTLSGTVCKILIQAQKWGDYDTCSLLLGAGCFLVWFGILRYLGFFHSCSIPVITLKCAMPNVLRFLLCASIMYLAYGFCGWVVLGPYHQKFRTLSISMECMFSLINGDDMFATFRAMSESNQLIYIFSRVYLYTFISLFIYVVLSLFIAVIMDTYETVKKFQESGGSESELHFFANECTDSPGSGCFRVTSEQSNRGFFRRILKRGNTPNEYTPLMD